MWRSCHFTIDDERPGGPLVHVELLAGGRNFRDPDDVARYVEAFDRLGAAAVTGEEARALRTGSQLSYQVGTGSRGRSIGTTVTKRATGRHSMSGPGRRSVRRGLAEPHGRTIRP